MTTDHKNPSHSGKPVDKTASRNGPASTPASKPPAKPASKPHSIPQKPPQATAKPAPRPLPTPAAKPQNIPLGTPVSRPKSPASAAPGAMPGARPKAPAISHPAAKSSSHLTPPREAPLEQSVQPEAAKPAPPSPVASTPMAAAPLKTAVSDPKAKIVQAPPRINQRPVIKPAVTNLTNTQELPKQSELRTPVPRQSQPSRQSAKPEPKLERQHLPAGMPRPRASLNEKSRTPSIGGLIHSMEAKPSKTPYYTAAITSVIWLFIGGLLGWLLVGQSLNDFSGYKAVLSSSSIYILAAAVLVPIALFWFIAQLVVRSQEMKLMASAMTEVAIRLAEPDKMAEQRVASVGQTIRRQVSAMDDAISRAIGRAGELEALVHNEVAALERSYSQNEYIIRNLLNELGNEREAIAYNSLQVKQTLQGVGAQVTKDIQTATVGIGQNLAKHGTMSALKLQQAGDQVTSALKTTTEQTVAIKQKFSAELPQLLTKINEEQEKLGKVIDGANRNLGQLDGTLAKRTADLDTQLNKRTVDLDRQLRERTAEIDTMINKHSGELNKRLVQKVKALDASLAMRTKSMDKTLSIKARDLDKTFLTHREDIDTTIQQKAKEIDQAIAKQAKSMDASLTEKARIIDTALTQRLATLDEAATAAAATNTTVATAETVEANETTKEVKTSAPSSDLSMLRGSEALERAMQAESDNLHTSLEDNSASLDNTIHQQNELSPEITALKTKHTQLLKDLAEQSTFIGTQFSAQGNDLRATAGLLNSPDMKMSVMMGPQQNKARAILADIAARSEGMKKSKKAHASALDNSLALADETASVLQQLLSENASPRAEQASEELELANAQNLQNTQKTKEWMEEYTQSLSQHVVEMVSGMSRSSSRTKILPGEVTSTSTDIKKSVHEQLQALDALAHISGAAVSTNLASATGSGTTTQGRAPHGQDHIHLQGRGGNVQPPPAPAPRADNANRKPSQWSFGDLLARVADTDTDQEESPLPTYRPTDTNASSSTANRKTSFTADPIDVLRMDDIARALDSHTAALAWKRSQAGERNVFTRRLYTPEGQATFDQISERYQRDEEFRTTVEKYVIDFEGLMNEAKEKDPSGSITQNYLTSETGRAYLVLAHISGRLG